MENLLICKECKEKYKNVFVLDENPTIDIVPKGVGHGMGIVIEKRFQCKICSEWSEFK
jgi:hypothetical protein